VVVQEASHCRAGRKKICERDLGVIIKEKSNFRRGGSLLTFGGNFGAVYGNFSLEEGSVISLERKILRKKEGMNNGGEQ